MLAPPWPPTLYAVPASHPCAAVERALQLKGVGLPARRADPRSRTGRAAAARFGATTVPGAACSPTARRSLGSRPIMRALDERVPEPPLAARRRERAGASSAPRSGATRCCSRSSRRVVWAALSGAPGAGHGATRDERASCRSRAPVARLSAPLDRARRAAKLNDAHGPQRARRPARARRTTSTRVDGWIDDGVARRTDAERGADLQIGSGLRAADDRRGRRAAARRAPGAAGSRATLVPGSAPARPARARCPPTGCPDPERRAGAADRAAPGRARRARRRRGPPPGTSRSGVELEQRHEHEAPRRHLARAGA